MGKTTEISQDSREKWKEDKRDAAMIVEPRKLRGILIFTC